VQWYTKLPAVDIVTLAVPPGLMRGVVKPPLSAFASCVAMSSLVNWTVEPTATVTGLGEKAFVVRPNAPLTMLMFVTVGAGVGVGVGTGAGAGVGVGAGAGLELLQAARLNPATRTSA
jgi:hypothetical protein